MSSFVEPTSQEAVERWIAEASARLDPFADVRGASDAHRVEHGFGCTVFPTSSGPFLGVLAAAIGARRILELGCGLGYSALCLACGAAPEGHVETIERDPRHAELARRHIEAHGYGEQITIHVGPGADLLPTLGEPYDLVFCDADPEGYAGFLEEFLRLLRPGRLLLSANLFLGQFDPDIPGLEQIAEYRARILDDDRLRTAFVPGGMSLSVRR